MTDIKFDFTPPQRQREAYHPLEVLRNTIRSFISHDSYLAYHALRNPGNWECMEIIYSNKPRAHNKFFPGFIDFLTLNSQACRAIRSRRHIVIQEISNLINQHSVRNQDYNILSLGSGPAHDIMATFSSIRHRQPVFATCVDVDARAIEYGRELAHKSNLNNIIDFIHGDASNIKQMERKYDMASVIGLLEYLSPDNCVDFLSGIKEFLHSDSRILICNMREHSLSKLMAFIGVWTLQYRRLETLEEITRASGFDIERSYYCPHGLNSFIVARNRRH